MLLDEILPERQFQEVHATPVDAKPREALMAAKETTPGEMPLVRLLFGLRSLPAIFSRRDNLPSEGRRPRVRRIPRAGIRQSGDELLRRSRRQPYTPPNRNPRTPHRRNRAKEVQALLLDHPTRQRGDPS